MSIPNDFTCDAVKLDQEPGTFLNNVQNSAPSDIALANICESHKIVLADLNNKYIERNEIIKYIKTEDLLGKLAPSMSEYIKTSNFAPSFSKYIKTEDLLGKLTPSMSEYTKKKDLHYELAPSMSEYVKTEDLLDELKSIKKNMISNENEIKSELTVLYNLHNVYKEGYYENKSDIDDIRWHINELKQNMSNNENDIRKNYAEFKDAMGLYKMYREDCDKNKSNIDEIREDINGINQDVSNNYSELYETYREGYDKNKYNIDDIRGNINEMSNNYSELKYAVDALQEKKISVKCHDDFRDPATMNVTCPSDHFLSKTGKCCTVTWS